ncbi:YdcF family protein [Acinetobacter indicus]|uniref:YdcF family protein n=1 Tax=Acinetobacter indicus TaxID=756892 RepID=UPI0025785669|nr:YdcF family protein [Acinetobacter indicus]MDM1330346.1 YdcF family protein [Acinetobacter indicus]MDM1338529.1 YdcF family protein [Acinetobacter indicus]
MNRTHWMVRIVQMAAVLFVLMGCLVVFIYSPFYSKFVIKVLNIIVPVEVNEVAAQSQQMGALTDQENLEPGSNLWIARQAYLKVMEEEIQAKNSQNLTIIQARYKALQALIQDEQRSQQEQEQDSTPQIPLLADVSASEAQLAQPSQQLQDLLELDSSENQALMEQYLKFLRTHEVAAVETVPVDEEIFQDIALIQQQNSQKPQITSQPYAIVVLGGGLTLHENQKDIIVNNYTRLRLEKTLEIEKQYKLPIVLSGVEAPYMQKWLAERGVEANLLEDRSMNTCENSRFSSLLLQKKGGAPTVILITDQYHMPRTRRLFALNGIETVPVVAPIPTELTQWQPSEQNYDHSRRANYEMLATIRDMLFGSSDCREVP